MDQSSQLVTQIDNLVMSTSRLVHDMFDSELGIGICGNAAHGALPVEVWRSVIRELSVRKLIASGAGLC
jgi:hypothetical protein